MTFLVSVQLKVYVTAGWLGGVTGITINLDKFIATLTCADKIHLNLIRIFSSSGREFNLIYSGMRIETILFEGTEAECREQPAGGRHLCVFSVKCFKSTRSFL